MKKYIKFDLLTGGIIGWFSVPDFAVDMQIESGIGAVEDVTRNASEQTHYVTANGLTVRPTQLTSVSKLSVIADGVDSIVILNAPVGGVFTAKNMITGESVSGPINVTDTFITTSSGIVNLTIQAFPFLDWEQIINAI